MPTEKAEHRKLAAIMFTDMVGYSALSQRNEALALELLEEHRVIVRGILPKHGGREVKTTGDGFLLEFPSALAATQCAVALQQALHQRNQSQPVERQVQVRIGIHVGDVVTQAGDIHGDGVNVAARIEPLATPGGICVTRAVFEQIENKVPQKLVRLSRPELKNISANVEVYRLVLEAAGAQPSATRARKILAAAVLFVIVLNASLLLKFGLQHRSGQADRTGPSNSLPVPAQSPGEQKSVAVLPFLNLSADKADEYLSDGMTEELLNALAGVKGLRVPGRSSSFAFKGKNEEDIFRRMGEQLHVGTVLEGSVRKAGDKLRITAQLINVADGFHLWSEEYDRDMTNIFAIQSDIAARVADALKVQLLGRAPQMKKPTENIEAYKLYLRARQLWDRREHTAMTDAIGLYKQAIAADPAFALAYAGLADCYVTYSLTNLTASEAALRARAAALKAIELDGTLGEPHASLAMVQGFSDWNWSGAEAQFRRAMELNPNYATAHAWLGIICELQGRCGEAIAELQRAQALDPLSSIINSHAGLILCMCGKPDSAIQLLQRQLALDPSWVRAHGALAQCYFQQGKLAEAIQELEAARRLSGKAGDGLGFLYARAGRTNDALDVLRQLGERQQADHSDYRGMALIEYGLGDDVKALDLLERAAEAREEGLPWLATLPYWKDLRSHPRFQAILRRMNLAK